MAESKTPLDESVRQFALDPCLLHKVKLDLDKRIVGEDENKLQLFLIGVSSFTDRPLGAVITGESVDVDCSWPVKKSSDLQLSDLENFDIIISASPLYLSMDQEFTEAAQLTNRIYKRLHWKRLVYTIMREASNFLYSRLKVTDDQTQAKSQTIYMLREARHCGLPLGLDSVRFFAIDIDVRSLSDFMFLKSQGLFGLTHDLKWLYSIFNAYIVRSMPPQNYLVLTKQGGIGLGEFPEVSWHKKERENILRSVGIQVEYGEPVEAGEYRGVYKTVGDMEHADIIRLYIEGYSMAKIAKELERSTATIHEHIIDHNKTVDRNKFCPSCRRVRSEYKGRRAERT